MNEIIRDLRVLFIDIWYYISAPFYRFFIGYTKRDLWHTGYSISIKILPLLKAFRKSKLEGYPNDFKSFKEWIKAIDEMIYGLEYLIKEDDYIKFNKNDYDRAKKGRELFGKYLGNLWD